MKKTIFLFLIVSLLFVCGCTPSVRVGPYVFYQESDQIVSIDILETDARYTGLDVPSRVIHSLDQADFASFVSAVSNIDGAYNVSGTLYIGSYAVIIHYADGAAELLFPNNSVYISSEGERDISTYDFGEDELYSVLSTYCEVPLVLPD